ncbi:transposase [Ruegeria sp. AU67]|uniref:transposase n=1 Tax=Ruegeria sp. AU67 TaxID=2108530 RepID=UPI0021019DE8|nr:transposase [Ruegeria sp. AU67]
MRQIDRKWRNNRNKNEHAALKRLLGFRQSFRSLRSAKATLSRIETIRTIKHGQLYYKQRGVRGEIEFIDRLSKPSREPKYHPLSMQTKKLTQKLPSAIPGANEAVGAIKGLHRTKNTLGKRVLQKLQYPVRG